MSNEIELLTEIRDLLKLLAEPALAARDAKQRAALRKVVADSSKRAKAVLLMDGTRSQAGIAKESSMDNGNLSRLVKLLSNEGLILGKDKPQLTLGIPPNFFDQELPK